MSGPVRKRDDQKVRRNLEEVPTTKVTAIGTVVPPDLGMENPHPLIVDLYNSMKDSAQSRYYEPSDWQFARVTFHFLNDLLWAPSMKGSAHKLQTINQMFTSLLLTEGDRRRVRMEIERSAAPTSEGGKVLTMADHFAQALGTTVNT